MMIASPSYQHRAAVRRSASAASRCTILLVMMALLSAGQRNMDAMAFSASTSLVGRTPIGLPVGKTIGQQQRELTRRQMVATVSEGAEEKKHLDSSGNEFTVGSVVRVATESIKAYQVPPKGRGGYDPETKEFVPAPAAAEGGGERGDRCLQVPVGLRGVVTRVYDSNQFDALQPIVVKFVPEENTDEGFDPPVTFMMHFDPKEIQCVV